MKILLHTCCGPCTIYPVRMLRDQGMDVMGFFYRYNIHPFQECLKRESTLREFARAIELPVIFQKDYQVEEFFRSVAFREKDRCRICYHNRLDQTAALARKGKFEAFSTTLLYSRFQNHDAIREIGQNLAEKYGIRFFYSDFREGWKFGIEESKRLGMYRQQYCGCIYSEKERYCGK